MTSTNIPIILNTQQSTATDAVTTDIQQPTATAVVIAPDVMAMDLLDNLEEDGQSASEQNAIINAVVSITAAESGMVEFEEQSIITSEELSTASSSMQKESSVVTVAEETEKPHILVSEATGDQSESDSNSDHENVSPNKTRKRKQAFSGVKLQKSTKKHAATDMLFVNFKIKWDKVSENYLIKLQNLQKFQDENPDKEVPPSLCILKPELNGFINEVVNQLRLIDVDISAEVMANVAKQIIEAYPCLDSGDDDGFGRGQGYIELKYKMINRNYYLKRFMDEEKTKTPLPLKKKRKIRSGTDKQYWENTTNDCSKEMYSKMLRDEPELMNDELLEQSQAFIRHTLDEQGLEQGNLNSIVKRLPVLRRRVLLNYHFLKATGVDVETLRTYFAAKREKIIDYSNGCRKLKHLKDTDQDIEVFSFLCSLVGEEFNDLVIKKEVNYINSCCSNKL